MSRHLIRHALLVAALLAILVGYLFLAAKRLSLGPLLLVIGYCLLFPAYLWQMFRGRASQASESAPDAGGPNRRDLVGE
jgi:hypothetical protein